MKHLVTKFNPQLPGEGEIKEFDTLLAAVNELAVFSVSQHKDGFIITEECDGWHAIILTPEQLRLLGEELIALSKT